MANIVKWNSLTFLRLYLFQRFDPDNDGFVSLEELKFVLSNLPVRVTDEEMHEITQAIGAGACDGKITKEKFCLLMGGHQQKTQPTSRNSAATTATNKKQPATKK